MNPRVIRLAMWTGGVALLGLLIFLSGVLMFGPTHDEGDEHPRGAKT